MHKTIMSGLLNSVYSRINYAPEGLGGGGEGDDDDGIDTIPVSDEEPELDDDGEPITDAKPFKISDLFKAGDGEGDDDDDSETAEEALAAQTALAEELKAGIESLRLPDDIIPEDFDASDRTQLAKLLTDVQTHTASNAIRLMFKPVQATLTRMSVQMRREIRDGVKGGIGSNNAQAMLLEAIPAAGDPEFSPVVKMLFTQAQKKHPNDSKAAVTATKKAMLGLGMDVNRSSRGGRESNTEGGQLSGKSALDSFGLRLPLPNARNAQRLKK